MIETNKASMLPLIRSAESYNQMPIYQEQQILNVRIQDIKLDEYGHPIVLQELFNYFLSNEEFMKVEQIFRRNAAIEMEKTLELQMRKFNFGFL